MPNPENLRPFTSENQPDTASKSRKGIPNGSTVARIVLSMAYETPADIHAKLVEIYPDLPKKTSIEFVGALQQAYKMINEKDTNAYKALHERAYGAPKQEIEQTNITPPEINITVVDTGVPIANRETDVDANDPPV